MESKIEPIFDGPIWTLKEDRQNRNYGYANNFLQVHPFTGKAYVKYIQVPTQFFTLMRAIYSQEDFLVLTETGLSFEILEYTTHSRKTQWHFGIHPIHGDNGRIVEVQGRVLWYYTPAQLPGWLALKG